MLKTWGWIKDSKNTIRKWDSRENEDFVRERKYAKGARRLLVQIKKTEGGIGSGSYCKVAEYGG